MADARTTSASRTSTSSTPTYTPFTISSFSWIPLTTTFTARDPSCSDIHLDDIGILHIDDDISKCLPSGFNSAPTAFFSPGIACPSGYWSACGNNNGVSSISTITCCPTRGTSIHMSCVPKPESLAGPWVDQYCTWTAGAAPVSVEVVQIKDGSTSKMYKTLTGVDGINAFGVRMVQRAQDTMPTELPSLTTKLPQPGQESVGQQGTSSNSTEPAPAGSGLSKGAMVAIGVIVPVVAIAALVAFFMLWRKRRREALGVPGHTETPLHHLQVDNHKGYQSSTTQELPSHHQQAVEMPGTRAIAELSADTGPGAWQHQVDKK